MPTSGTGTTQWRAGALTFSSARARQPVELGASIFTAVLKSGRLVRHGPLGTYSMNFNNEQRMKRS
ncbi:MAG: hypothetical protein JWN19_2436 [Arthrobacter sp.]|nr:hypothetical protein [Arthrobacter sp.]